MPLTTASAGNRCINIQGNFFLLANKDIWANEVSRRRLYVGLLQGPIELTQSVYQFLEALNHSHGCTHFD